MKLRNKKTGEIVEYDNIFFYKLTCKGNEKFMPNAQTISELDEDWEDYEEPKEYWFINTYGDIKHQEMCDNDGLEKTMRNQLKGIGNYFENEEEADKAVEKLKAWKRIKENIIDHILKYEFDESTEDIHANISFSVESYPSVGNDLDLLFGGEK